jgi:hypothetical protein
MQPHVHTAQKTLQQRFDADLYAAAWQLNKQLVGLI